MLNLRNRLWLAVSFFVFWCKFRIVGYIICRNGCDFMKRVLLFVVMVFLFSFLIYGLNYTDGNDIKKDVILEELVGMNIDEVLEYGESVDVEFEVEYQYSSSYLKDIVIFQNKEAYSRVSSGDLVKLVVSLGDVPKSVYQENGVNELGMVPIMMYHGIVDKSNSDTGYIGGNVDRDGYNRTVEAFRNDLEFYYNNGYRMIRLNDYVDGVVDVEIGKSPIILTFDDGNENNFRVLGEENGELLIDPNCAVGILEEFKAKYPDYGVTATFFVNSGLFGRKKYNEKIIKWLVSHGYDVGNHTMTHVNFTNVNVNETMKEVGNLYNVLDNIIPNKYVYIVALPFGSPYSKSHSNYASIINSEYNGVMYHSKALLRVGWEAEVSCFDVNFDSLFLKRIRAYDNNGKDFDIEMNFKILENKRYVSDGDIDTVVILKKDNDRVNGNGRRVIWY